MQLLKFSYHYPPKARCLAQCQRPTERSPDSEYYYKARFITAIHLGSASDSHTVSSTGVGLSLTTPSLRHGFKTKDQRNAIIRLGGEVCLLLLTVRARRYCWAVMFIDYRGLWVLGLGCLDTSPDADGGVLVVNNLWVTKKVPDLKDISFHTHRQIILP